MRGIEPPCPAWEAGVLPLNYTREKKDLRRQYAIEGDRDHHCHEITSSSLVPVFLSDAGPGMASEALSFPIDQAMIPPFMFGENPAFLEPFRHLFGERTLRAIRIVLQTEVLVDLQQALLMSHCFHKLAPPLIRSE